MAYQQRLIQISEQDPFRSGSSYGRLRSMGRFRWVEDSMVTYDSPLSGAHDYVGVALSRSLYVLFVVLVCLFFGIVMVRVVWLQVVRGGEYALLAESNRTRHISVVAERGLMFDRHGVPLVHNTPRYELHIFPNDIPREAEERAALARTIASLVHVDVTEAQEKLDGLVYSLERDVLLYDRLSQQQAIALSVASADQPALRVETGIKRTYAVSDSPVWSLSHIVGYEGKIGASEVDEYVARGYSPNDYVGKQGVEAAYEDVLRGVKGDRVVEVTSRGTQLAVLSEHVPRQGSSLTLSVDVELQRVAEAALRRAVRSAGSEGGVVVVQAVESGDVLAMVSLPAFVNESFAQGLSHDEFAQLVNDPARPLMNRATSGLYPSGSTIKPMLAVAALAEGVIGAQTTILSTGGLAVGPWFFPDWRAGGHGRVDVRGAIADSVNTFFYVIGGGTDDFAGLGVDRMYQWLRRFGFGEPSGIDVRGEQAGLVPHPDWKELRKGEQWYIGDTYNLSIGQGDLLVTPIQLASAVSTVANGGQRVLPRLVRAIDGVVRPTVVVEDMSSYAEAFLPVRAGMRDAVLYGSARSLADLPISVAGKTGTAQWSSREKPHAWFVGFAPYERPEISVTVLVEEGEEGSRVAVPVAREVFLWWHSFGYALAP